MEIALDVLLGCFVLLFVFVFVLVLLDALETVQKKIAKKRD